MPAKRWWAAAVCLVLGSGSLAYLVLSRADSGSDCSTVRELIGYNADFNAEVNSDSGRENTRSVGAADYKRWATRLDDFASRINDPELSRSADSLADLADQMVPAVAAYLNDRQDAEIVDPQPYVSDFARIGMQFDAELSALNNACPA